MGAVGQAERGNLRDLHMYSREGVQLDRRAKIVTSRWPDPGTSKIDLGFPRTP